MQNHNLKRRVSKIEEKLEPQRGRLQRLPNGKGGFIEIPSGRSIFDILAICGVRKEELDETERK